jgi:hypothetical protein
MCAAKSSTQAVAAVQSKKSPSPKRPSSSAEDGVDSIDLEAKRIGHDSLTALDDPDTRKLMGKMALTKPVRVQTSLA